VRLLGRERKELPKWQHKDDVLAVGSNNKKGDDASAAASHARAQLAHTWKSEF